MAPTAGVPRKRQTAWPVSHRPRAFHGTRLMPAGPPCGAGHGIIAGSGPDRAMPPAPSAQPRSPSL